MITVTWIATLISVLGSIELLVRAAATEMPSVTARANATR